MLDIMLKNSTHWRTISGDFYSPRLQDLPWSEDDFKAFTTYGFIIAWTLLRQYSLPPISPFLIAFFMLDFEAAISNQLLNKVVPDTLHRLKTWPPANVQDLNLTSEPMIMLSDYLDMEVCIAFL